jgi:excisionase family DNA binding protein
MSNEERIRALLDATPQQLAAVDAALSGQTEPERPSLRLLRMSEAARQTGLSRTTLWRAISEGRLPSVEIRKGSRRIPEAALRRWIGGAA